MELGMNRREFNRVLGASIVAGVSLKADGREIKGKPNLLYIFADQMRFSAMGCMAGVSGAGEEPGAVRTPNLDTLAREGVLFTHAFSTTPVCSPYRVGLQTGKYCHEVGYELDPRERKVFEWTTGWGGKPRKSTKEIAEALKISIPTVGNIKRKIGDKIERYL